MNGKKATRHDKNKIRKARVAGAVIGRKCKVARRQAVHIGRKKKRFSGSHR